MKKEEDFEGHGRVKTESYSWSSLLAFPNYSKNASYELGLWPLQYNHTDLSKPREINVSLNPLAKNACETVCQDDHLTNLETMRQPKQLNGIVL